MGQSGGRCQRQPWTAKQTRSILNLFIYVGRYVGKQVSALAAQLPVHSIQL